MTAPEPPRPDADARTPDATLDAAAAATSGVPVATRSDVADGEHHAVVEPAASDMDPKTGEPRRHWLVWAASALFLVGAGLALAGLLLAMWQSVDRFPRAAWLNGVTPTNPGDGLRVAMVVGLFAIAVLVATLASIAGHYAWRGYGWTRWWGVATAGAALLTLMIDPLASASIAAIGVAAGLLWTPPVRRYAQRCWEARHPVRARPSRDGEVFYGPLPRFR